MLTGNLPVLELSILSKAFAAFAASGESSLISSAGGSFFSEGEGAGTVEAPNKGFTGIPPNPPVLDFCRAPNGFVVPVVEGANGDFVTGGAVRTTFAKGFFGFVSFAALEAGATGFDGAFFDNGGNDAVPDDFDNDAVEAVFDDATDDATDDTVFLPNGLLGGVGDIGGNAADVALDFDDALAPKAADEMEGVFFEASLLLPPTFPIAPDDRPVFVTVGAGDFSLTASVASSDLAANPVEGAGAGVLPNNGCNGMPPVPPPVLAFLNAPKGLVVAGVLEEKTNPVLVAPNWDANCPKPPLAVPKLGADDPEPNVKVDDDPKTGDF